jgi:hypothetical protein
MRDDSEFPLLKSEGTNFSRLKMAVYWMLWAVAMSIIIGCSVGAIAWMVLVFGVHDHQ